MMEVYVLRYNDYEVKLNIVGLTGHAQNIR